MTAGTYAVVAAVVTGVAGAGVTVASAHDRRARGTAAGGGVPRVGLVDALRAAAVGFVLAMLAVVAGGMAVDLDGFGTINVAYAQLVVAVPLASGLVLIRGASTRARGGGGCTRPVAAVLAAGLLPVPLGLYATFVEPYRLEVETIDPVVVGGERGGSAPLRIGVLSDLQTDEVGPYERGAFDRLLGAAPDLILLPGDVLQGDPALVARELPAIREFARLTVPGGAYLVPGDTDDVENLRAMTEGTPVRLLVDEIAEVRVRDRDVTVGGVRLDWRSDAARRVVADLESRPGSGDIRIVLAHRPDVVEHLPAAPRTDLVVAGHTHGGQVAVPLVGPILTMTGVPRQVAAGGLHALAGRRIYVARGVGLERGQAPKVRFLVPPNIGILTVR